MEQEDSAGGEHAANLGQHGPRLVDDVEDRGHGHQVDRARGQRQRLGGHVVHGQRRVRSRRRELAAVGDHRRCDVVAVQGRRRVSLSEIAKEEAGATSQIDHRGVRWKMRHHVRVEELPVRVTVALRVRLDHALEQVVVRRPAE